MAYNGRLYPWDVVKTKGRNVGVTGAHGEDKRPVLVSKSKDRPNGRNHDKVIVKKFYSIEDKFGNPTKQESIRRGDLTPIHGHGTNLDRKSALSIDDYILEKSNIDSSGKIGSLKIKQDRKIARQSSYSKKNKSRRQKRIVSRNRNIRRNY